MTTQTVRPNGTRSGAGAYTITGSAATIDAALSDQDDGTYVERTSSSTVGSFVVDMGTITIPSDERVRSVALQARMERPTDGLVYVRQGIVTDPGAGSIRYAAADQYSGSFATGWAAGADRVTAPDGQPWTQTALNNLVVKVTDYASASTAVTTFYELSAVITLNEQPSASVTAPSGSVTSGSRPAIEWTFTDADGDEQSVYEARVFTAAQYGAAGFDPSTSEAFWDTGLVESPDPGVTPAIDLDNGETFRAYVRLGHNLGTTYYMSEWAYSQFTLTYEGPAQADLSVAFAPSRNVVEGTATGRTNYLSLDDSSFESGIGTWDTIQGCSIQRSTLQSASGVASLEVNATSPGTMKAGTAKYATATDGQEVSARAEFRADAVGRVCRVYLRWFDASNTLLSESYGSPVSDVSTGWVTGTVTAFPPAGATQAEVAVEIQDAVSGEDHFVDKVAIHPGPIPAWSPGGLYEDQVLVLERSDDDGVTWQVINEVAAGTPNQVAQFEDFAAPRDNASVYRARAIGFYEQDAVAGPYSEDAATLVTNDGKWWLKAQGSGLVGCPCPALNIGGARVRGPVDTSIESKTGVFYPLGRDRAVVVTGDVYGQDGTYEVTVIGQSEWDSGRELLLEWMGNVIVQDPFGDQKVVRIVKRSVTQGGTTGVPWWTVALDYVEV